MPADLFKVIARFVNADGQPFFGSEYKVTLLDEDRFFDDKLGSVSLSEDGTAEFVFSASEMFSIDSLGERTPDLYFLITEHGNEVFRSEVIPEVDFDSNDPVSGRQDNTTREFGPFQVS